MTPGRTMTQAQREEIRKRCEAALALISALCQPRGTAGAREWIMSIPARPDYDPDIVLADALKNIPRLLDALDARDALLRRVLDTGHSAGCALMDTTIYHMNRKCDCPLKDVEALLAGGK